MTAIGGSELPEMKAASNASSRSMLWLGSDIDTGWHNDSSPKSERAAFSRTTRPDGCSLASAIKRPSDRA
jgi:hypothetical protein